MQEPAWLPAARALPFGRKAKFTCTECHTQKTLMVSHDARGFSAYCFRASCGHKEFHPHGMLSLAQLRQRQLDTQSLLEEKSVSIPKDALTELPPAARLWTLRSGVNSAMTESYGILYSVRYGRVILPVYAKDCSLDGLITRSLDGSKPKYISKFKDYSNAAFFSKPELMLRERVQDIDLVLTEDILSAIRVGRLANACAILGTSFGPGLVNRVMDYTGKTRPRIGIWTDPDKAGRHSCSRIRRALQLQGADVFSVMSEKDPKYYSNREIRTYLSNTR